MNVIAYVGTPYSTGMFYKVIDKLCARYKIGITATCYRNVKRNREGNIGIIRTTYNRN